MVLNKFVLNSPFPVFLHAIIASLPKTARLNFLTYIYAIKFAPSSFSSKDVVFAVPLSLSKICDNGASLTVLLYSAEGGSGSVSDGLRVVLYHQANISRVW
jgi:hypothetical protein